MKDTLTRIKIKYIDSMSIKTEFILALSFTSVALFYAMWPVLFAPNSDYPLTVDGMGHLAKVEYIAKCLKSFEWPSWFPYWYNGSTVMQYYPPLSYITMVPFQLIFNNVMIVYKIYIFLVMLVGSIGVWYICRKLIGRGTGILAGVFYAIQPFLLILMITQGVLAQGPIFAITPWFLYFTYLFFIKPDNKKNWLIIMIFSALLILSHPMHAFIICFCIGVSLFIFVIIKKTSLPDLLIWILAIAMGLGITAFWWIPGVTHLENSGLPMLLTEAVMNWTATIKWFSFPSRNSGYFYFSLAILVSSFFSIPFLFIMFKKKSLANAVNKCTKLIMIFYVLLQIITIVFSFGQRIPIFKLIPFSNNIVPGRILSLTSVTSAILIAFVIRFLIKQAKFKYFCYPLVTIILLSIFFDTYPANSYATENCSTLKNVFEGLSDSDSNYEKGRFTWISPISSKISYLPMLYNFNMSEGWNIEGTLHNQTLWSHNIAIPSNCQEYVIKNLFQWNVRSVMVNKEHTNLIEYLKFYGFNEIGEYDGSKILYNLSKSSYFHMQNRNAIIIGSAAPGLAMTFPWMVQGRSPCLENYTYSELQKYQLIYLAEPEIKNADQFEYIVKKLASQGVTVIIEAGRLQYVSVLDTETYLVDSNQRSKLVINGQYLSDPGINSIPIIDSSSSNTLFGLDEVYGSLVQENGKSYPVIGAKKIGNEKVYFIGMALSQMLEPSYVRSNGMWSVNEYIAERSANVKKILEQILDIGNPSKGIVPEDFPVEEAKWSYNGVVFTYNSTDTSNIVVSVTYTPRWKIFIDGKKTQCYDFENLIGLELPSGYHTVQIRYGTTWVDWFGIAISLAAVLITIFLMSILNRIEPILVIILERFTKYMNS